MMKLRVREVKPYQEVKRNTENTHRLSILSQLILEEPRNGTEAVLLDRLSDEALDA